ncbi:ComF family protein [Alkalilimnicola sp. S0819]|nr:ComF family protein [Alkalilimnicola sp. S0819]MPQ16260.1 ComF family protein [Alkalilimnicola sp. S0819]
MSAATWVYIRSLFEQVRELPQPCRLCHAPTVDAGLCQDCANELPRLRDGCPLCAEPDCGGLDCARCQAQAPPVSRCLAAGPYAPPLDGWIKRLKFHADLPAGALLASLLSARLAPRLNHSTPPQALVPIPLHPRRLRQRGYNQALELSRGLGRRLGLPLRPALLRRVRDTVTQSRLPARRRAGNLHDAFRADVAATGLRLALVDDVMTTGETAYAAARALRQAGAAEVELWVVARAGRG